VRTRDLPQMFFTEGELFEARLELSQFVELLADQTRARFGFGWEARPDAPNTWAELREAWQHSLATGNALPVFDGANSSAIFTTPEAHLAYRFWHDVTHLERNRNFTNPHELDMASYHLLQAEKHGLERGSLPWRLLHADAVGQVLHWSVIHEFVINQRVFVLNYIQFGVESALLAEMARTGLLRPQVLPLGIDCTTESVAPKPPTIWTED
jgi:hypothetical protein